MHATTLAQREPEMRSVLRIIAGSLFLIHGTMKVIGWPPSDGPMLVFDPMTQMGIAGVLEACGGAAIVLGLLTRPVAFLLAGEMAVAYFQAHAPRSPFPVQNGGELAALYCFLWLYLFVAGPGSWSLDNLIGRVLRLPRTERRSGFDRRSGGFLEPAQVSLR